MRSRGEWAFGLYSKWHEEPLLRFVQRYKPHLTHDIKALLCEDSLLWGRGRRQEANVGGYSKMQPIDATSP